MNNKRELFSQSEERKIKSLSAGDVLKTLRVTQPERRAAYVEKLYYIGVLGDVMEKLNASRRMQFYQLAKKNVSEKVHACMCEAMRQARMRGR